MKNSEDIFGDKFLNKLMKKGLSKEMQRKDPIKNKGYNRFKQNI